MRTIVDLLARRAREQPSRTAFIFLEHGERERERLTWRALDRSARRMALLLDSRGVRRGDRVPIVCPPGLRFIEAFFGCLYAGVIAVPLSHGQPRRLAPRLGRAAGDCGAAAVLFDGVHAEHLVRLAPGLAGVAWIPLDAARLVAEDDTRELAAANPDDPAFLQYTSGSVADPKGVVITHANLVCNQAMIQQAFGHTDSSTVVGWLPLYHDMGLVGNVLQPVYVGCTCVLMSPIDFVQEPFRWLDAISRHRGTTSGAPNFAYDLCVSGVGADERARLDLSSWQVAFNGSEPVRASTIDRFAEAFAPCGFRRETFFPCYGLAEATLFVTGGDAGCPAPRAVVDARAIEEHRVEDARPGGATRELVSCGRAYPGIEVAVVDPVERRASPPDAIGEIWIRGDTVAAGYWDRAGETASSFGARRADTGGGPYLRTGDLGFVRGGELFVAGRWSDLIVVRGRNHHPHEIERAAAESYAGLRRDGGAAFLVRRDAEERLVVILEIERGAALDFVPAAAAVRSAIAWGHEVTAHDVVFVRPGGVPRTTSGKVRRHACREMYLAGALPVVAAPPAPSARVTTAGSIESLLAAEIGTLLGVPAASVNLDRPLASLGLDSLMAAALQQRLDAAGGPSCSLADLLQAPSMRELARRARRAAAGRRVVDSDSADAAPADEMPLSQGQRSLWFLAQLAPESAAYHVTRALSLAGALDAGALRGAFGRLAAAHAALRTTFAVREGEPVQRCHDSLAPTFESVDVARLPDARLEELLASEAARPFDLARGPLLRAHLFRRSASEHVLLVVAHHLVVDLWSMQTLVRGLHAAYSAAVHGAPDGAQIRGSDYRAFVRWQESYLASPKAAGDLAYWRSELADLAGPLALPTDHPRPAVKSYRGAAVPIAIEREAAAALRGLARESGCTLYTTMLSAFMVLLSRTSGQQQVVVGSPSACRDAAATHDVVGFCANMLPLVGDVPPLMSFRALLDRTRRTVVQAIEHQEYPLPLIVERLNVERRADGSPLFDASFVWHGRGDLGEVIASAGAFPGLTLSPVDVPQTSAQFDVGLTLAEGADGVTGFLEYNTDLFTHPTAERLAQHFGALVDGIAADANRPVAALPMLSAADRSTLLAFARGPVAPCADGATVVSLFEAQSRLTPERVAVSGAMGGTLAGVPAGDALTYAALQTTTRRLAARLRHRHSVGPGDVVAVAVQRSALLVAGVLGTLRAGAAFLPIDPADPPERIAALLRDARCRVVLTTRASSGAFLREGVVICLDESDAWDPGVPHALPAPAPADLAYVIFTSGSSGRPKGVMVEHGGLVNRVRWMVEHLGLDEHDVILQKTPATFDVAVWELLLPLTVGARLVLLRPGGERDPDALIQAFRRDGITTAHFVPSMLSAFLAHLGPHAEVGGWRRCVCSGEALTPSLRDRFFEAAGNRVALYNFYGPTEAAIDVTWQRVTRGSGTVPIGRPAANTSVYVLDAAGGLVPGGVPGEIAIAGVQVARGYVDDPALTAAAFRADPFVPEGRLYLSGDRGRWRADGTLEYLGRADDRLKVRGWRVEPHEIESAILAHPGIAAAAVAGRRIGESDTQLVAYYVGRGTPPTSRALSSFLRQRLPGGLVPTAYVVLDALPMTASGKLDRRRLPDPGDITCRSPYEPPASPAEETLAGVWAGELGVDRVSVLDSFFDLGGDSIRAVRVAARARDAGLDLSVEAMFRHQTIRRLAEHVTAAPPAQRRAPIGPFALIPEAWRTRVPHDVEDAYPLSMVQRALVFLSETRAGYEVYVTTLHVRARFDEAALRESVAGLVARHAFLRVSFDLAGFPEPVQLVHARAAVPLDVVDWRGRDAAGQERALADWLVAERRRAFDWTRAPMLRVTVHRRTDRTMQVTLADASLDGWCVASLITELFEDYLTRLRNDPVSLPRPRVEYRDFVAMERAAQASAAHEAFWRARAHEAEPDALVRGHAPAPHPGGAAHERIVTRFDAGVWQRIREIAADTGVPAKSVLLAAYLAALARSRDTARITTGLEVHGRPEEDGGDRVVGVFNNMVPLTLSLEDGTWRDLARRAYEAERDLLPFRRFPHAALRKLGRTQLFDALFVYTHFHVYERLLGRDDFEVLDASANDQTFLPLTAHFTVDVLAGGLRLLVDFDRSAISTKRAAAFAAECERAVATLAADPDARYDDGAATRRASQGSANVYELLGRAAADRHDAVAVAFGEEYVTFGVLHERAARAAGRLRALGAGPEVPIGLCVERRPDLVVMLLAILRAGSAYVPLDPEHPPERLAAMLADSGAPLVITEPAYVGALSLASARPLTVEELVRPDVATRERLAEGCVECGSANAAYVIFTSGSTGRPKGVVVEHGALRNYVCWAIEAYGLREGGAVPVHTSLAYDLTVTSVFGPLAAGTTLHLLPSRAGIEALAEALQHDAGYALLKLTPSHLAALARTAAPIAPGIVRSLVVGGEALHMEALGAWPGSADVFNEYGPTEATVGCCVHRVHGTRARDGAAPIGRPIANMQAYVLDVRSDPAAPGAAGELYIGGVGLARGYAADPAGTALRFVPDPIGATPGARLYRTGDLARRLPDGDLAFVGRLDDQIKIRGHRIEPGDVESHLVQHPGVRAAAVAARRSPAGSTQLVAFVEWSGMPAPRHEVLAWLRRRLPDWMIPVAVIPVDALPLSPGGKVDRRRLPYIEVEEERHPQAFDADGARLADLLRTVEGLNDLEVAAMLAAGGGGAPGHE